MWPAAIGYTANSEKTNEEIRASDPRIHCKETDLNVKNVINVEGVAKNGWPLFLAIDLADAGRYLSWRYLHDRYLPASARSIARNKGQPFFATPSTLITFFTFKSVSLQCILGSDALISSLVFSEFAVYPIAAGHIWSHLTISCF